MDVLRGLQQEASCVLGSPAVSQKLRAVENLCEKSALMLGEALSVQRAYRHLLRQLQCDTLTAQQQMNDVASKVQEHDGKLATLEVQATDVAEAWATAAAQLARVKANLTEQRNAQDLEVTKRRAAVASLVESNKDSVQQVRQLQHPLLFSLASTHKSRSITQQHSQENSHNTQFDRTHYSTVSNFIIPARSSHKPPQNAGFQGYRHEADISKPMLILDAISLPNYAVLVIH